MINDSLSELFNHMSDDTKKGMVMVKVAALNQLYSTAIMHIVPVVDKIVECAREDCCSFSEEECIKLVDKISSVAWKNKEGRVYSRNNLSFASKYVHFLSGRRIPIYDSYVWIIMIGYVVQGKRVKMSFSPPNTYRDFIQKFYQFKELYKLDAKWSNYDIDKFLWQYGKDLLEEVGGELKEITGKDVSLDERKRELKYRILNYIK